jgi:hypothetical protein
MQPQSPTCLVCPNNVRGSELTFTGKPTTACGNRKKLAFILPDDPSCTVYEMQIPPASLTNLKSYSDWVKQQGTSAVHGDALDIADVVTRISFDPDKQFVLAVRGGGARRRRPDAENDRAHPRQRPVGHGGRAQ